MILRYLSFFFQIAITFLLLTTVQISVAETTSVKPSIPQDDPSKMLQYVTDELLVLSKAARHYAKEDPERYYQEVDAILKNVVDIEYFSRAVMATYASSRLYKSLKTEEQKEAFKSRIARFTEAMKRVLLVKYADALLAFIGERIDLSEAAVIAGGSKVSLQQTIYDLNNQTYVVQYSLYKKDDKWMVYNVIVEGVNLGGAYRTQFSEAIENNKGDIDFVVDHWVELMSKWNEANDKKEKQ